MRTIHIRGEEHATPCDALNHAYDEDRVIGIAGRFFTVDEAEYRRVQGDGIQPTTWH